MTTEPHHVDPNIKKPAGGERYHPGHVNDTKQPGTTSSTAPTPTKPCDDSGCAAPNASASPKAGNFGGQPANPTQPQPGSPGPQPTPTDPNKRPANQGNPQQPLPQPQPPGRPKGQTTGQQPVTTNPKPHAQQRPGEGVKTDRNGKTYEGKTGVSGETAEGGSGV